MKLFKKRIAFNGVNGRFDKKYPLNQSINISKYTKIIKKLI